MDRNLEAEVYQTMKFIIKERISAKTNGNEFVLKYQKYYFAKPGSSSFSSSLFPSMHQEIPDLFFFRDCDQFSIGIGGEKSLTKL